MLAWWGEQYDEPWFVLTDLAPTTCAATWYGLRNWCEQGFKCNKRGAWQWQLTRMHHPHRAALWTVAVASDIECDTLLQNPDLPDWSTLLCLTATLAPARAAHTDQPTRRIRLLRLLRLGRLWLLAQAIAHRTHALPSALQPEPWPAPPPKAKDNRRSPSRNTVLIPL